ncbi:hypothetical protein Tco_0524748 [Tanacetum coccineum]
MRELSIDYGPTPFRFFHSWFNLDGFDKMIEDTWKSLATVDSNDMINLKKKLQALKIIIKQWTKNAKKNSYKAKISIQSKLSDIDKILDQGGSNEEILSNRSLLLRELNDINSIDSLEAAQKSKVRWAIEGDENTKFFHGILNSKRSQLAIRGTLVDGEWIVDPLVVKSVFLKYFSTQFSSPVSPRICFADQFTNRLSLEQQVDLERNVSNEEIKSAVWDCGTNKSLGPDGFTFEFFCRYWKLLEHDIVAAVKEFFTSGIKVGGAMYRIISWDDVVAKVSARLSKWKLKTFSIGGRLTLIKSVLTSIPLYHMSIFKVPSGVLKLLESIRRNFFDGVDGSERKMAWINWNKVLASKKYGSLGVSSFYALNQALLFK